MKEITDWVVEDLGEVEDWVYDIEVEDCHNFFANGILVHNSIFVSVEEFVKRITNGKEFPNEKIVDAIDAFAKKEVEPELVRIYERLANALNMYKNMISMKREKIMSSGIWRAKKQYAVMVYDNEGVRYAEPKFSPTGIEIVRSSTPGIVKVALQKAIMYVMDDDEDGLQRYVSEFKKDYFTSSPEEAAFPRGVNDIDKWLSGGNIDAPEGWKKGTPLHFKAAIAHNMLVDRLGLHHKIRTIKPSTKIKFFALKDANPIQSNAIGWVGRFPEEFKLDSYLDWNDMFERSFKRPLSSLTNLTGIEIEKINTVMGFFDDDDDETDEPVLKVFRPASLDSCNVEPVVSKQKPKKQPETNTDKSKPRKKKPQSLTIDEFFGD